MTNADSNFTVLKMEGLLIYPKVFQPDTMFDEKWTTDLLLDADGVKEAKENNLRVKHKEKYADLFDGYDGSFLKIEKPTRKRDGSENDRPIVKAANGRTDVPVDTSIGNGTRAKVRFTLKTKDMYGKELSPAEVMKKWGGYGMYLTGVQILDLVEYERTVDPETDFVEEDGSFEIDQNSVDNQVFDFDEGDSPFADESKTA